MKTNKNPLVSVIIVTYNSQKYIAQCLEAIQKQPYKHLQVIVVDNDSQDKTLSLVKRYSFVHLLTNRQNFGFSKANNQGITIAKGEYVLLLNPDAFLTKDSLQLMLQTMISDKNIAFVSPKLLKPDKITLDSTGIVATSQRRFFDRGREEIDNHQYDYNLSIFAGCGAALFLRKKALDDILLNGEYLDEHFFAYYEDVDLCWRLRLRRWKGIYCPESIIYHSRGHNLALLERYNLFSFFKKRYVQRNSSKSFHNIRKYAFRNSFWILFKNDSLFELTKHSLSFTFYLIKKFAYVCFFEPYVLKEVPHLLSGIALMLKKRKIIRSTMLISDKNLRPFFL